MEGTEAYDNIMDKIHVDYGKPSDVLTKWKGSLTTPPPVQEHTNILPNTGNLIPNAYYQQLKGWYEVSCVPEIDRSEYQKKCLTAFKWQHTVDPKDKRPWTAPSRPRKYQHRNYNDFFRAVLGDRANGTVHRCQNCTLMTVYPVTSTAHAMDVAT